MANSTVSGNVSAGDGGGVVARASLEFTPMQHDEKGNLIPLPVDNIEFHQVTFSGNIAARGGGLFIVDGFHELSRSTVTENVGDGGVYVEGIAATEISGSVISGNLTPGPNLGGMGMNSVINSYLDGNAELGPLAENGGPTLTHLPLLGSPLLDAGDPNIPPGETDQRGFPRVVDGNADGTAQADIGAAELDPGIDQAVCDFDWSRTCDTDDLDLLYDEMAAGTGQLKFDLNSDGFVDLQDIAAWLGDAGVLNDLIYVPGDANLDGTVDGADFTALASNFGSVGLPGAYWSSGNFDGNAGGEFSVGGSDFTTLAANYGQGGGGPTSAFNAGNRQFARRASLISPPEERPLMVPRYSSPMLGSQAESAVTHALIDDVLRHSVAEKP